MSPSLRIVAPGFVFLTLAGTFTAKARAGDTATSSIYRDVNPDRLSGGLYSVLEDAGAFGPRLEPPRAAAAYPDLSKGHPPVVLDPRVGPNVRLGDDDDALPATQRGQVEPHLVRSSANSSVLLASFQEGRFFDAGGITCGYAVSHDGGFTWRRALTPALTNINGGRFNRATDPVAGAGPQGDLYLQALASAQGAFSLAAVVVSRSTDHGATWSAPTVVFESNTTTVGPDKNWLAVNDHASAPNSGRLVSTWTNFLRNAAGTSIASPLVASVSDDRGLTWSAPIEITPQASNHQGTQPVFLPDGSLAVIYITFLDPNNVTRFSIQCKLSPDGGRTFPATASTVVPVVNGWDDPQLRDGVFLPCATASRLSGDLFVTYTATFNGTPRVMVTRSTDRGATWTTPVVASDQPAGISVTNPAIAASPDGQTLTVVFTDKRHAPNGADFVDHYAAMSFDGGATWQPNIRLSDMSSDIRFAPLTSRGRMLGDYLAITAAANGQPAVAIWCDTRTGDADPFVTRFLPAAQPDYGAWSVVRGASGNHLDDDDVDGVNNYLEFVSGTDPRVAESGEDIVLHRSSETTFHAFWTDRIQATRTFNGEGVAAVTAASFEVGGFSTSGVVTGTLAADQLPTSRPRDGLRWRGGRVTLPAGTAAMVTRAYRFSAGLPVRTAASAAAIDTDARLVNLASRGRSGDDASAMIAGFVIDGNKTILVRAAGPALAALGVSGALANPSLTLSAPASDLQRTNDNWQLGGAATPALFTRLGAFPFSEGSLDAALALPLGAQRYTARISGAGATSGVTLVEAYDADPIPGASANARLVNLSTRGEAGAGENTLIAGFVLSGTESRRVLIRVAGPSLAQFGVAGTLVDPVLTLFRGDTPVSRNDDWEISRSPEAVAATAQRLGAFPLNAASLDAALLITLGPGAYTVVIGSADGGTGLALVEIYDAD